MRTAYAMSTHTQSTRQCLNTQPDQPCKFHPAELCLYARRQGLHMLLCKCMHPHACAPLTTAWACTAACCTVMLGWLYRRQCSATDCLDASSTPNQQCFRVTHIRASRQLCACTACFVRVIQTLHHNKPTCAAGIPRSRSLLPVTPRLSEVSASVRCSQACTAGSRCHMRCNRVQL